MVKRNPKVWMAVHEDTLFWLSTQPSDLGRCIYQLPLEPLLDDGSTPAAIPDRLKGNNRFLCLVPDHWFGMESYPFQSSKPSLVEAFLERKLAAGNPARKSIAQFFNYQHNPAQDAGHSLYAHFLQEETAYRLNRVLHLANLAPLGYTTPAFLWAETLAKASPVFADRGSLLAHVSQGQGRLYFYFNGIYQFSRVVMLPGEAEECIGALTYEINQSLYLFSQKTKSELGRIYLYPDDGDLEQALEETLGREVTNCKNLWTDDTCDLAFAEVPALCGLLHLGAPALQTSVFSIVHRRIKRQLEWRPVQLAGIAIALLLIVLFLGEALFLKGALREARQDRHRLQRQVRAGSVEGLASYTDAFEQVLQRSRQPSPADTLQRLLDALPANVRLEQLDLGAAAPPNLAVTALVKTRDMDHLRATLADLAAGMKASLGKARELPMDAIDVAPAALEGRPDGAHYRIAFQMELE